MSRQTAEFSLYLNITDAEALARAAARMMVGNGTFETEDAYFEEYPVDDSSTHIRMLLDPGSLDGCDILDSACELGA